MKIASQVNSGEGAAFNVDVWSCPPGSDVNVAVPVLVMRGPRAYVPLSLVMLGAPSSFVAADTMARASGTVRAEWDAVVDGLRLYAPVGPAMARAVTAAWRDYFEGLQDVALGSFAKRPEGG